jgi:putative transposase
MCQVLGMSPSGYYAWCRRSESAHTQRDRQLRVLVRASFDASKHRYGSPRIHEDLLEQRVRVSRKRVIRLMQEDGLQARARKRFKCTTMSDPRSTGGGESARTTLHSRRAQSALGRGYHRVRDR